MKKLKLLAAVFLFFSLNIILPRSGLAGERPVAILVNGFGDCCTSRMGNLIDSLKAMGVDFPAVARRGLDGSKYEHYVVPWNSFSALDQGFQVSLDPQYYVQQALTTMATSSPTNALGGLASLSDPAALMQKALDPNVINSVMTAVRKGSDEAFVNEASAYINSLPADTPIILIGHSFGADSVLEVLNKINREVSFVATLDPVGTGGLRRLIKDRKFTQNIGYFFNRWQQDAMFPFDYTSKGSFAKCVAKKSCDQALAQGVDHVNLPTATALQQQLLGAIKVALGAQTMTNTKSGSTTSLTDQLKTNLGKSNPLGSLLGN